MVCRPGNLSVLGRDSRSPNDFDRGDLRMLGEVHLLQEGLEAGVGAEGVNERGLVDESHERVVFLGTFL